MAIKVLEYDINISKLRSKLVNSKKITDEKFWKNYFYHVEVIKCKYHMKIYKTKMINKLKS